jgi:hypothetical protein
MDYGVDFVINLYLIFLIIVASFNVAGEYLLKCN